MERVGRNLIRGTAKLTFVTPTSSWDDGTWQYRHTADGDSVSVIDINDSSIPNIKYGIRINRVNNSGNAKYIDIFQNGIELKPNTVYTMSAWVRGAGRYAFFSDATFVDDRYHNISEGDKDKWIHISSKIQTNDSVISQFMIGSNVSVEMCGFKLEEGDTATAWSPAPEDSASYAQSYIIQPIRSGKRTKSIKNAVVTLDQTEYTYDKQEHAPNVVKVMLKGVELKHNVDYVYQSQPATNAGEHNVIVFGIGRYGDALNVPWTINKAQGSISVNPSTIAVNGAMGSSNTAELTIVGDGDVTFGKSDYVSLNREGSTLTVTSIKEGGGTVDIILNDGANYKGSSCTLAFTVSETDPVLENNSWEVIAKASAKGIANEIWTIGDTKTFHTSDGSITYTARIIGFNHDDLHATDEKYGDVNYNGGTNKAGITFDMTELFPYPTGIANSNVNTGGWARCMLRNSIRLDAYQEDLRNAVRIVNKITGHGGQSVSNDTTADTVFLLSEVEVTGGHGSSNSGEGTVYEYYKNGGSRVKIYKNSSSARKYWLRSPSNSDVSSYRVVSDQGGINSEYANNSAYYCYSFCV